MKIKVTTIREIDNRDFDAWLKAINMGNPLKPINGKKLLEDGKFTFESVDGVGDRTTYAKTTYEIIER